MFKKIFFMILFCSFAFGVDYTFDELKQMPNSLAKDYYIYKLINNQTPSISEADEMKQHIKRYVGRIKNILEKISPTPQINTSLGFVVKKNPTCYGYSSLNILKYSKNCQKLVIENDFLVVKNMTNITKNKLIKIFTNDKDIKDTLIASNRKKPMQYLKNKNAYVFLRFWTNGYKDFDDFKPTKQFVNALKNNKNYDSFIQDIIISKKYPQLRQGLIHTTLENLNPNTAFYLGINALSFKNPKFEKYAFSYFQHAYNGYFMQEFKDNALFWMYYLSKNKAQKKDFLQKLANSNSINIYSIYAKEKLNIALPSYDNGITNAYPTKQKHESFDIKNPFEWQNLSKKITKAKEDKTAMQNLANEYFTKETLPHFAYIDTIASGYKNQYFIMPYSEYLQGDLHRQALILAIARQESRFIPAAISTSYALGMMQFMPFLADHVGKNILKMENFDADFMFEPKTAYEFANIHLDYLEKYLHSPVFIAYAYNGGLGFTKKMLKRNDIFKKGRYEPFLSMEFVPYMESRIYAKKVLANYIIYSNLLGERIKILKVFAELDSQTDQTLVKPQS